MEEGGNTVTVDIESLATSIENMMGDNLYMPPECCIFKTPAILFRHNEKAYVPDAFSIGPFHRGKQNLTATQKIKVKYLRGLLYRAGRPESQVLRELIEAIKEIEGKALKCYAGSVDVSEDEFVKILLLDGCFIVELFRKDANVVQKDPDDPIFTMSCLLQFLNHDLILLENQIPWFVLELLFNKTKATQPTPNIMPLDQLAIKFFGNMFSSDKPSMELFQKTEFRSHKSKHILDLLRNWLILSLKIAESGEGSNQNLESREGGSNQKQERSNQISGPGEEVSNETLGWQPLPSATSLKEAGIKFNKVISNSILDVQFRNGVLEMPSLLVQETTETIFRNLISFEQCTPNYTPRITSYAKLIDNLIDTTKDMEILCKKKIIDNWLNLEDATQFFNKLYNDAYVKEFYYLDLCNKVNEYCESRWHRWRANLRHNYLKTPWAIVGIIVAGLILVLTIVGTVCSILQVI